jgi:hypothetical protein
VKKATSSRQQNSGSLLAAKARKSLVQTILSSPMGSLRGLADRVVRRALSEIRSFPGNPRRHPEAQIASLMKNIKRFRTNPILIDEDGFAELAIVPACRSEAQGIRTTSVFRRHDPARCRPAAQIAQQPHCDACRVFDCLLCDSPTSIVRMGAGYAEVRPL